MPAIPHRTMQELLHAGDRANHHVSSDVGEAGSQQKGEGGNGLKGFARSFKDKSSSLAWVRTIILTNA